MCRMAAPYPSTVNTRQVSVHQQGRTETRSCMAHSPMAAIHAIRPRTLATCSYSCNPTQTRFESTQTRLESTQTRLESTQTCLESTQTCLESTQTRGPAAYRPCAANLRRPEPVSCTGPNRHTKRHKAGLGGHQTKCEHARIDSGPVLGESNFCRNSCSNLKLLQVATTTLFSFFLQNRRWPLLRYSELPLVPNKPSAAQAHSETDFILS